MAKLVEKDGKFYRMRRGELVEIPPEWVGKHVHAKTIRQRNSKKSRKAVRRNGGRWMLKWDRPNRSGRTGMKLAPDVASRTHTRHEVLADQLDGAER